MQRKLTPAQAVAIRHAYASDPSMSQQRLADIHGVTQVAISLVVRGLLGDSDGTADCKVCGESFEQDSPTHAYCSDACFVEGRRRRKRACWAAAHPKPEGRVCPHCGTKLAASKRANASYCSTACEQAAHNATRKASWKAGERQERVSRAYIIARDNGTCHLCGGKPDPADIHLDHVIPLARGGSHEAENIRVACAPCNLRKGARASDDQLMLVG